MQTIDQTELCNGMVLRNLMGDELSVLNQMLSGRDFKSRRFPWRPDTT